MADKEEVVEKKSGGLLPIINLVLLILVLGVGGFIAWKMVQMEQPPVVEQGAAGSPAETEMPVPDEEDESKPPVFVDIADITINLADADVSRFLRAKIKLELRSEESTPVIEQYMVQINDMVITLLSSKTFAEIRTPQGKYDLKEDLVYRINRLVPGKPIKNLYFTDFVSQ
ncbi:MAG: flagellar protein FliL [Zetaproteobacteria bacterium CG2_30_46_52]|nr:MAG: flagellar protein FliL [Zetaproteobacteria bacterium CG2_30_46_52]